MAANGNHSPPPPSDIVNKNLMAVNARLGRQCPVARLRRPGEKGMMVHADSDYFQFVKQGQSAGRFLEYRAETNRFGFEFAGQPVEAAARVVQNRMEPVTPRMKAGS
jgi:hypothetical protein